MDTTLYEEWLLGEGLEDSTILNYRGKIARAVELATGQGWDLKALTASQIRWVANQYPQTRSTLGQLKAALNHYWRLHESTCPIAAIRLPSRSGVDEYKGLEDGDADRLENVACGRSPDGLAVMLGLYLALRRGEMVRLRWEDFDEDCGWVDVLGKGNRRRWLPVHPNLRDCLTPDDGWVFPGRMEGHAHAGSVYLWVERVAQVAGLRGVNPHSLRHTCLTRMYEETGDVRVVQQFAGHSDPATTARYTRVPRRRLEAAVGTLNYRAA